jgi:tRNA(Ile2) C34 agmatinyltransferase TiaS
VTLPTAATANIGKTIYRCEKCGMTYSAADAKRLGYIDPMDGGKLVPVSAHQ